MEIICHNHVMKISTMFTVEIANLNFEKILKYFLNIVSLVDLKVNNFMSDTGLTLRFVILKLSFASC